MIGLVGDSNQKQSFDENMEIVARERIQKDVSEGLAEVLRSQTQDYIAKDVS